MRDSVQWAVGSMALLGLVTALVLLSDPSVEPAVPEPSPGAVTPPKIDLSEVAARLTLRPPLTTEQLDEDARMEAEQVSIAAGWLNSANPQLRVGGAEQLAAYPTVEAEQLLRHALRTDPNPEVRSAAAQGLKRFKAPAEDTISALLTSLADAAPDVRSAALLSLEGLLSREASGSRPQTSILRRLKAKRQDAALNRETRKAIVALLQDRR
jgi:HEAT repeat protein